jgi:hypothetical protein
VNEQGCSAPEETPTGDAEPAAEGGFAVGRKVRKEARPKAGGAGGLRAKPGAVLESDARLEPLGTPTEELERLARRYHKMTAVLPTRRAAPSALPYTPAGVLTKEVRRQR